MMLVCANVRILPPTCSIPAARACLNSTTARCVLHVKEKWFYNVPSWFSWHSLDIIVHIYTCKLFFPASPQNIPAWQQIAAVLKTSSWVLICFCARFDLFVLTSFTLARSLFFSFTLTDHTISVPLASLPTSCPSGAGLGRQYSYLWSSTEFCDTLLKKKRWVSKPKSNK